MVGCAAQEGILPSDPSLARASAMLQLQQLESSFDAHTPALAEHHAADAPGAGSTRAADSPKCSSAGRPDPDSAHADRRNSHRHASCSGQQTDDLAAVGALLVQLHSRKLHHVRRSNLPYWQRQIRHLPPSARALAQACLDSEAHRRPSVANLLQDDFFSPAVRVAAACLAQLGWPEAAPTRLEASRAAEPDAGLSPADPGAVLARLAGSKVIGQLQQAPGALALCLPTLVHLLEAASLAYDATDPGPGLSAVLGQLLRALTRQQVQEQLLPLLRRILAGKQHSAGTARGPGTDSAVLAAVLHPELLWVLIEVAGMSAYLDSLHAEVLELISGRTQSPELPSTAGSADLAMQVKQSTCHLPSTS